MVCGLSSAVFGVGSVLVFHLNDLPGRIARAMTEEGQRSTAPAAGEALRARSTAPRAGSSLSLKIIGVLLFLFAAAVLYAWVNQAR